MASRYSLSLHLLPSTSSAYKKKSLRALGIVNLGVIAAENGRLGQTLNDTLDIVAGRIALRPLGSGAETPRARAA